MAPPTGITRTLARHIVGTTFADLPEPAIRAAKRSLLDAIAVSLGASGCEPACAAFVATALEVPGPCGVLGFRGSTTPLMAAFANGALAHALDYEDAFDCTPAHPNAASVPVALALAEQDPSLDGRAVILALAVACDLVCRLALALDKNPDDYGFYTPPIVGAFGAAACAAKLLRLDEDECVSALGLTLTQAMCSSQLKRDPRSSLRAVRDAFAAQAGLSAGQLAARGVYSFEAAFEGEHGLFATYARGAYTPQRMLEGLGARFLGERVSFKPWPSCRGTHAYIEASLRLRAEHALDPQQIEAAVAHGAALNRMLAEPVERKRAPQTAIDAKFSLPYCVAVALRRGAVRLDDFAPEALADPHIRALADKIVFQVDPTAGMRDATRGVLELQVRGMGRLRAQVEAPLGHPSHPLDDVQLVDKLLDCGARARVPLPESRLRQLAAALLELELAESARDVVAQARVL